MAGLVILVGTVTGACGTSTGSGATVVRVPADAATISAALDRVSEGGLVLISPGVYDESVEVTTPNVTLRGTDRNAVVIDGGNKRPVGVLVTTDGVRVQNLTVRSNTFYGVLVTGMPNGGTGRGGGYGKLDPKKSPPVQRFLVDHVTAINNGLYGIYAFDSQHGAIQDSYASGSPDSGIYVGQCQHCDILVTRNVAERNAVGFENANASDSVSVIGNRWSGNRVGMTLLSDYQEAFVPQRGNTVAGNVITNNTSADSPAQADGGFGIGVGISGGQDNRIVKNLIGGNPQAGIVLTNSVDIPAIGNRIEQNSFAHNGIDAADTSTAATPSKGNCLQPGTGLSTLPIALASAVCPTGTAAGPGVQPDALPKVETPPGMPFTDVPMPKDQPNGDGSDTVPAHPLPATIEAPSTDSLTVPDGGYLANLSGTR